MSDTTIIVIAAAGLGIYYLHSKKSGGPMMPPPLPPNYGYPYSQGQATPPNPNQYGGVMMPAGGQSDAQQAASIIGAIGGLAQGIGSVVRGISDWGSGSGTSGNDGYSDTLYP